MTELGTVFQELQGKTDEEDLRVISSILKKLSLEDRFSLIFLLSKKTPALTETKFFIDFASDPEITKFTGL